MRDVHRYLLRDNAGRDRLLGWDTAVLLVFLIAAALEPRVLGVSAAGIPSWTMTGAMHEPRENATATLLRNGQVLVAGGGSSSKPTGYLASAELYDPRTGHWTRTGALNQNRAYHTATLLPDGKVLVVGGDGFYNPDEPPMIQASAELYDPRTGRWTRTGSLHQGRYEHMATLLANGQVLVAGGANDWETLASAEVYDPHTGRWTTTGHMRVRRAYATATLLADGRVLVTGGRNYSGILASTEIYDPRRGRWTRAAHLPESRAYHTATLLQNGDVLVVGGGNDSGYVSSAELYDPRHNRWVRTGNPYGHRTDHTATLLPSGQVLVAGGTNGNRYLSSAELYNPRTGRWVRTADLHQSRGDHTATLLRTGQVLIAGGITNGAGNDLSSAELYNPNGRP